MLGTLEDAAALDSGMGHGIGSIGFWMGDTGYHQIRTNPNPLAEMCLEYLRLSTYVSENGVGRERRICSLRGRYSATGAVRFQDVPKVGQVGKTQCKGLSLT